MQNDSMHCTSGTMAPNEAAKQDSAQSFNCNHCVLIFKTRIYLYEHLHQVHGLDIDAALRDSGLKSAALNKAQTDINCKQSDFAFNCKNCNFKSGSWAIYSEHKKKCPAVATTISVKSSPNNENPAKTSILINKCKEPTGAKPKSSLKDVRIYTKSSQTITKYFSPASELQVPKQDPLPVENVTTKTSPLRSPLTPSPTDPEPPKLQSSDGKHTCLRCKMTFMSLKGLRSHERSHAALAAIKKMDNLSCSVFKQHIEKYLLYRSGTTRPFRCKICSYRTTVMGLWKSHIIKNHQYVLNSTEVDQQNQETPQEDTEDGQNVGEELNALEGDDEPENSYLEPPDVQRQLTRYNLMAQLDSQSKTSQQEVQLSESRMLTCEMCNFNSPHMSTLRRHYLRRHGKKLIRCKDCNFFTCFRQNLDLHEEMGHFTVQSEPTHQKTLCCPFCLYQSKNKNNMIDHIVLHREERVTPIEVRRSKLSHYLQGIVFRCHKCTFTSGSADGLHWHMTKHNDIKPFKCRLCYFDCTELRDLEAHLCDKHQVVRNHQLVGQVSLDQLKARAEKIPQEDDGDEDQELSGQRSENMKVLKSATTCNEISYESQNDEQMEKNTRLENVQPDQKQVQDVMKENENCLKRGEEFKHTTKDHSNLHYRSLQDIEAKVENDLLQQILQLDEDGSSNVVSKTVLKQDKKQIIKMEAVNSQNQSSQEDGETAVTLNYHPKMNSELLNAVTKKSFKSNKSVLIRPSSVELRIKPEVLQDQESSGAVSANCNEGQTHNQKDSTEQTNNYGEMPVLEKFFKEVHFKDVKHELQCGEIMDDSNGIKWGNDERGLEEELNPPVLLDGVSATAGAAEVPSPPVASEALFPCDLCGRNLANTTELERHIMRHGL